MAKCTFTGLTKKQAKALAEWFESQGESDCEVWFDIHNVDVPQTDVRGKGRGYKILANGDAIVYCK